MTYDGRPYGPSTGRYLTTELDWAKCGTPANYRHHLRRGEKPCAACTIASRHADIDRRRRYRAIGLSAEDSRHGTRAGYEVWGCKCDSCKAWSRNCARARRLLRKRANLTEVTP